MQSEWYTREEAQTNAEFGCIPSERPVEERLQRGVVFLDKPFGPPSSQVTSWLRKSLELGKAGHFGTLDPHATGVLPVGLNRGTRVSDVLTEAKKEYVFEAELDKETPSEEVESALKDKVGRNVQVPPKKSAVKREERERELYEAELLEVEDNRFLARVMCESGFYVRVLVEQLGEVLGSEAELPDLRRTRQGSISVEDCVNLQEAVDAHEAYRGEGEEKHIKKVVRPLEEAVKHLPKVVMKDTAVNAVANGANLGAEGISKLQGGISVGDKIALATLKGELVAIATAEMSSEQMYGENGKAADLESVHMEPETYPKRW